MNYDMETKNITDRLYMRSINPKYLIRVYGEMGVELSQAEEIDMLVTFLDDLYDAVDRILRKSIDRTLLERSVKNASSPIDGWSAICEFIEKYGR